MGRLFSFFEQVKDLLDTGLECGNSRGMHGPSYQSPLFVLLNSVPFNRQVRVSSRSRL